MSNRKRERNSERTRGRTEGGSNEKTKKMGGIENKEKITSDVRVE